MIRKDNGAIVFIIKTKLVVLTIDYATTLHSEKKNSTSMEGMVTEM